MIPRITGTCFLSTTKIGFTLGAVFPAMHTAVPIRSRSNSASPQPKKIRLELEDVRVIQPKGRSTLAPHDTSASFVTAPPETSVSKAPSSTVNKRKRKQRKQPVPDPGTPEDVIWQELVTLLGASVAEEAIQNETEWSAPVPLWEEVQLDIVKLSSTGAIFSPLDRASKLMMRRLRRRHCATHGSTPTVGRSRPIHSAK
jgi:hypothetical protein